MALEGTAKGGQRVLAVALWTTELLPYAITGLLSVILLLRPPGESGVTT